MIIGVDIDGVITDMAGYMEKKCKKFIKKHNIIPMPKKYNSHLNEAFGLNYEQDLKFWDEYIWDYSENVKYRRSAIKYMKKLQAEGNKIYIITARHFTTLDNEDGRRMRRLLDDRFEKLGFHYDKILFTQKQGEKAGLLLENKCDLLIDDSISEVASVSKVIPVLCYGSKYVKIIEGKNITMVYSWRQIYKKLSEMRGQNGD